MLRAGIIVAALLCVGGGPGIRAQDPVSDETIRATVNVVLAPVTVLDRHGEYVSGLQPQDFRLLDNGKEQKIQVDVAFQPISLVIAVQANDHVEGLLPKINKIGSLIQPLVIGEQGEAAVMAFDHRFRIMQDFTSDSTKIESAIKKITPGSGSSRLIDAVIESVRMLRSRPANAARPAPGYPAARHAPAAAQRPRDAEHCDADHREPGRLGAIHSAAGRNLQELEGDFRGQSRGSFRQGYRRHGDFVCQTEGSGRGHF